MKALLIPTFVFLDMVAAVGLFHLIFGNWNNFWGAVSYWIKPDWISWWDGQAVDDAIGEFSLFLFFGTLAALVAGEGWMLTHL